LISLFAEGVNLYSEIVTPPQLLLVSHAVNAVCNLLPIRALLPFGNESMN
jgi:hypothetical protein